MRNGHGRSRLGIHLPAFTTSSLLVLAPMVLLLLGRTPMLFAADRIAEIKKRGELLWGADAEGGAPYVYLDPQNPDRMIGFEHDLAEALAAKLGVKARMVQNQWEQLVPALNRGNFDIILNGFEITPEHRRQTALTLPYYVYAQQIVVRAED